MFSSYHGDKLVWEEVSRLRKSKSERLQSQADQEEKAAREFVGPLYQYVPTPEPTTRHDDECGDRHIKRREREAEAHDQRDKFMQHRYNFPP